jgi:hypothetical protein
MVRQQMQQALLLPLPLLLQTKMLKRKKKTKFCVSIS